MLSAAKLVLLVAAVAVGVDAHGQMTKPAPFPITDKYRADCYVGLKGAGEQELQYAPVENLLERKQNQPFGAGFDVENGCRGIVADDATPVTELTAGQEFTVEFVIQAPHPGYLELAVVKPKKDADGKVMYEREAVIKKIENFATNSNDKSTTATIPTTISGCDKKGDCALQFYWHSDIAKQTYPTCASIIVKGGAAGGGASAGGNAGGAAGNSTSPTPSSRAPISPSTPSAPVPVAPAPVPAPSPAAPAPAPATGGDADDCDEDLPEPDCDDDLPEPAAGDADCDDDLPEPDCDDEYPEPKDSEYGGDADVPTSNIGFGAIQRKGGESAPGKVSAKEYK